MSNRFRAGAYGRPATGDSSPLGGAISKTYPVLELSEGASLLGADTDSAASRWPDLGYIRNRISIREVAQGLGLRLRGRSSAHCWRTEAHEHGDRSASVYFTRKNRWRCAVCDGRTRSNLDLIQTVLSCDLSRAVEWVTARWNIPEVPRGRHATRREPRAAHFHVGISGLPFETLVRSGVFAVLSKAAQALLPVILVFTDHEIGWATLSQRALRRYAGLSFRGVNDGLRELERIGLLEIDRASRQGRASLPSCSRYRLNFEAPAFLELQGSVHKEHRAEVAFEVACQRERRKIYTQGKPVSLRESTSKIGALTRSARD